MIYKLCPIKECTSTTMLVCRWVLRASTTRRPLSCSRLLPPRSSWLFATHQRSILRRIVSTDMVNSLFRIVCDLFWWLLIKDWAWYWLVIFLHQNIPFCFFSRCWKRWRCDLTSRGKHGGGKFIHREEEVKPTNQTWTKNKMKICRNQT